jgi:hypothetical protein
MERLTQREMEQILGVYAPFRIKNLSLDSDEEVLTVHLEEQNNKSRRLFSTAPMKQPGQIQTWLHGKTGRFDTVIKLETNSKTFSKSRLLNPPAFLGSKDSGYTYQLQQTVLMAHTKNIDSLNISALLGLERTLVSKIINDAQAQQQESQANSQLPLETDPIWRAIIKHETSFKTNFSALRFLISKLELTCMNSQDDSSVIQSSTATLRQFFVKHKNQLKSEYAQIGVTLQEKPNKVEEKTTSKKVKLTSEHPIWENILNGDIDLLSKNTGLNMYITQLKGLYRKAADNKQDQQQIAKELLSYLKKNMAKLKPELLSISKMVKQLDSQVNEATLPDIEHPIWERLANQEANIDSNQLAYKLLLVKAHALDDKAEAKQLIWQYFDRNQRLLSAELSQLESLISIAS